MHFKRLELVGFKSFLDKTILHFEPGVTAVVGPNGCGKSNVSDSIRWVLGEQSAKSLRGSSMEDVIFNGSAVKDPIHFAEVSLTLSNESKILPTEYEEVTITRRLYRSGESEYLINKNIVRLRDVSELLMGTGMGTDHYSVVEQGQMDRILNAKPEERREIFEEAAGITKYKSQKKEALRKLEQTETNLVRIGDIVQEVKRQIGSLERQAKKAEAYKREFEELKNLEVFLASHEFSLLEGRKAEKEKTLEGLKTKETAFLSAAGSLEKVCKEKEGRLRELDERLKEIQRKELEIHAGIRHSQDRLLLNTERIGELGGRRESLLKGMEGSGAKLKALEEQFQALEKEWELIRQEEEEGSVFLNKVQADFAFLQESIGRLRTEEEAAERGLLDLSVKESELRSKLSFLVDLKKKGEGLWGGVRAFLAARDEGNEAAQGMIGLLSELLKVEKGYEFAVEAALGDVLQAVVFRDNASLVRAVHALRAVKKGKAVLLSLEERPLMAPPDSSPAGHPILKFVVCDPRLGGWMDGLLARVFLAGSPEEALEWTKAFPGVISVTKEGERFEKGRVLGGVVSQEASLTLLGRESQIQTLQEELSAPLLEKKKEESLGALRFIQDSLKEKESQKEDLLVRLAETRSKQGYFTAKRRKAEEERRRALESKEKEELALAGCRADAEAVLSKKEALEKENLSLEEKLTHLQSQRDGLLGEIQGFHREREEVDAKLKELEKERDGKLEFLKGAREEIYQAELGATEIRFEMDRLKERTFNAYQVDLPLAEAPPPADEGAPDWEKLKAGLQAQKEKLSKMGPVNLTAIEEHGELKSRYDFLTGQQDDLLRAKEDLHKAILKMNRTTRELFVTTFAEIQKHFTQTFRLLFGGGSAELILSDEQDVLESGIEMAARPPGKKLRHLSLLSGGEKALTAIALLFALFKVKPSPFCVLDEIDAPLDESNIDRFCGLLKEFARHSQFILITHNKRTMNLADALYGITMAETGVSKIVSVRFPKKDEEPERKDREEALV